MLLASGFRRRRGHANAIEGRPSPYDSYRTSARPIAKRCIDAFGDDSDFRYETRRVHRAETTLFRIALFVAVATIACLATAPLEAVPFVGLGDKVLHASAFLVLAGLLDFSFPATRFAAGKVATLLAYGMAIEIAQHFLPFRSFSLLDWLADAGGIALYVAVATPILKRTAWLQRRWDPQVFQ